MIINTVKQLDVDDWNTLVSNHYHKPYSYQQQDDCKSRGVEYINVPCENYDYSNTEIPFEVNGEEMGVNFQTWLNTSYEDLSKYFDEDYENTIFWERNFYPHIDMIINDLYAKGLLEEGNYQLRIDW